MAKVVIIEYRGQIEMLPRVLRRTHIGKRPGLPRVYPYITPEGSLRAIRLTPREVERARKYAEISRKHLGGQDYYHIRQVEE